jgi:hypothetical protein
MFEHRRQGALIHFILPDFICADPKNMNWRVSNLLSALVQQGVCFVRS